MQASACCKQSGTCCPSKLTYSLQAPDGWFVNTDTGDVFGKFNATAAGSDKNMTLFVAGATGHPAPLETLNFEIVAAKLSVKTSAERTRNTAEFADPTRRSTFIVGKLYRIAPLKIDAANSVVPGGGVGDLTFKLGGVPRTPPGWYIDSNRGDMSGTFNTTGRHTMSLFAVDTQGNEDEVERFEFNVTNKLPFAVNDFVRNKGGTGGGYGTGKGLGCKHGKNIHLVGKVGTPYCINGVSLTNVKNFEGDPERDVSYTLKNAPRGFLVNPLTGAIEGNPLESTSGGNATALLYALDLGGDEALVDSIDFSITATKFKVVDSWDPATEGVEHYALRNRYTHGLTYVSEPIGSQARQPFNYDKDVSLVVQYRLRFTPRINQFWVDTANGATLFAPTQTGAYTGELLAFNCQGETAAVFHWNFSVVPSEPFSTVTNWTSGSLGWAQGYRSVYAQGTTIVLDRPDRNRSQLFENYAGDDAATILYAMTTTTVAGGQAPLPSMRFYVDENGASIGQAEHPGTYSSALYVEQHAIMFPDSGMLGVVLPGRMRFATFTPHGAWAR